MGTERTQACYEGLDELMTYLSDNGDVWHGITFWAGGPSWGGYAFSYSPTTDDAGVFVDRPQMDVVERHLPPLGLDGTPDVGGPDSNSTGPDGPGTPDSTPSEASSAVVESVSTIRVVGVMAVVSALLL